MKFSIQIPLDQITPGEFQTAGAIAELAKALENARIDACYITDHPAPDAKWLHAHGHDALDPFTALAFVAAASTKLMVHTNIVVLPYRNPFLTAKAAATLQVLSGGRLILGIGSGYQKGEFEALGVDFSKRGALTDEALEVLRLAWAGGPVVKQGLKFDATGNEPRPVPKPEPLVWIGGGSDKAVERAAIWGDGWSPFFVAPTMSKVNQDSGIHSTEQLGEKIKVLLERRDKLGKHGPFDVAIGPNLRPKMHSPADAERFLEKVAELRAVGVTWITADLSQSTRTAYLEAVQWFGEEVVARV